MDSRKQPLSAIDINLNDYHDEISEGVLALFSKLRDVARDTDDEEFIRTLYFFYMMFDIPLEELPDSLLEAVSFYATQQAAEGYELDA